MAWYDVFGTVVEEGDYILSSAATTGVTKVGHAYYSKNGMLMIHVVRLFNYGRLISDASSRSSAGTNVVVLKTKDGIIPGPVQNIW